MSLLTPCPKIIRAKKLPKRLNRIGKIGRVNLASNKILANRWETLGITTCEIKFEGCFKTWLLQNVHRHKRNWYRGVVELLSSHDQVLRGCQNCHDKMEVDKELTEKTFLKLRPKQNADNSTLTYTDCDEW